MIQMTEVTGEVFFASSALPLQRVRTPSPSPLQTKLS